MYVQRAHRSLWQFAKAALGNPPAASLHTGELAGLSLAPTSGGPHLVANRGWAVEKPVSLIISVKSEGSSQLQSSARDRLGSPLPPHMSHRPTDSSLQHLPTWCCVAFLGSDLVTATWRS